MSRYLFFLFPLGVILLYAMMFHPTLHVIAQNILIWGAVLFLVVAGLLPLVIGLRSIWRGLASAWWPTVPATVLKAGVSETEAKDQSSRATYTMYSAKLTFGYKVNGRDYSTETVQFGKALGSGDFSETALLLLRYPPGTSGEIRHHPRNPAIATVKPGVNVEVVLYLVAGLAFLAFAAVAGLGYLSFSKDIPFGRHAFSLGWLIMVALGLGMLAPGLQNLWRAYASPSWPTTRGVVVFADRDTRTATAEDSEGDVIRSTTHGAPLAYEYEVNGKKHVSNVRRFGQITAASKAWAKDILARYPSGANVPVWYSPTDPDLAVLEPGIAQEAYYLPGGGAAFVLFGLLAGFLSWKKMS